jgi:hypothetical protein
MVVMRKLVLAAGATILLIFALEILARFCPPPRLGSKIDCTALVEKYVAKEPWLLIDRSEESMATRIFYVPQSEIPGVNGVTCYWSAVFVSADLPPLAKKFVTAHEMAHMRGENNETLANFRAAKEEPLGLLQTILHSVFVGFQNKPVTRYPCVIGNIWTIFKIYFLGGIGVARQ